MPVVIGVRFKAAGKIYYFDPGECDININEHVIVETARGVGPNQSEMKWQ